MTPERQPFTQFAGSGPAADTVTCPSCRAQLVAGMRFCRLCGFRLGDGLAEYTETVRLNGVPLTAPQAGPFTAPARGQATSGVAHVPAAAPLASKRVRACGKSGANWLVWVVIALVLSTGGGAALLKRVRTLRQRAGIVASNAPRSFFGTEGFDYVEGQGVLVRAVLPGGPADRAGLRDGDFIQQFNGRDVRSADDMRSLLRSTPPGRAVPVTVVRDGAMVSVTMTTVEPDSYDREAFLPPNGAGYWGVSDFKRVPVPGENIYGVRVGSVRTNQPADIAGLKRGDIVVEFDGRPVRTGEGLSTYIDHAAPGTTVEVVVVRDGQRLTVPVKTGRED
jgi:membrane-associated protease RseP (regulator of RpoE activity)